MKNSFVLSILLVWGLFLGTAVVADSPTPPLSELYANPERIDLTGYIGDAMEPCISLDGKYLYFNSSNDEKVPTHICYARRIGPRQFELLGLLNGTVSKAKDMAPTIDSQNRFYFTSLRTFANDHRSIYCGQLEPSAVKDIEGVGGIVPTQGGWIDMDCGVSPDGRTLIFSRAQFQLFRSTPVKSDLIIANRDGHGFRIDNDSDLLLHAVNTSALEYAPTISSNGLELYFTRCYPAIPKAEIMIAVRKSKNDNFGEPASLAAIKGFTEAPSLTLDCRELFYHKKEPDGYRIFRVTRSRDLVSDNQSN